jgi:hypothetical protein
MPVTLNVQPLPSLGPSVQDQGLFESGRRYVRKEWREGRKRKTFI